MFQVSLTIDKAPSRDKTNKTNKHERFVPPPNPPFKFFFPQLRSCSNQMHELRGTIGLRWSRLGTCDATCQLHPVAVASVAVLNGCVHCGVPMLSTFGRCLGCWCGRHGASSETGRCATVGLCLSLYPSRPNQPRRQSLSGWFVSAVNMSHPEHGWMLRPVVDFGRSHQS